MTIGLSRTCNLLQATGRPDTRTDLIRVAPEYLVTKKQSRKRLQLPPNQFLFVTKNSKLSFLLFGANIDTLFHPLYVIHGIKMIEKFSKKQSNSRGNHDGDRIQPLFL